MIDLKTRVLVFPCGSQPAIDINFALRHSLRVEIYGASSVDDHGTFVYERYIGGLPKISEEKFIDEFNDVLRKNKIDFIIPTHDTVSLYLIEHQHLVQAQVIASDLETAKICRSKKLMYRKFEQHSFSPRIYWRMSDVTNFPVFIKPDQGQGGQGVKKVNSFEELQNCLGRNSSMVISEYLPGEELTVDCFTDRFGNIRVLSPRTRDRVFGGISVKSKFMETTGEISSIAHEINNRLNFRGYWYFQLKKDKSGMFKLLEISTRMAGTACLTTSNDINLPLLSILDFQGLDYEIIPNRMAMELDRSLVNRYKIDLQYERVYVDLDDTIIFNSNKINNFLMMFLYQCLNREVDIILITKHREDVKQTLDSFQICPNMFSQIIQIGKDDFKYRYMNNDIPSIFIDNSFEERKQVKVKLNIPTFDLNMIDCLIDWRG
ncbi:ATP-grasp domain-containing protein [Bacillus sp. T33-2]|uniref:ATP-grasp domain-containing protein n=1 Tax=Bacillus sp. T33-2 TaxID=2054168 RepID=UPI000C7817AE|nr:ATP-grasp domain-containing protein [Bacillus sp. T33-2]PLR90841.1 carbamoylphosphate synthase large subunit short form [Bacillus sp. T33-2]